MKPVNRVSVSKADDIPRITDVTVGLNLIGGGTAWLLHLLLSYLVAEFGCLRGLGEIRILGITAVAWLLILVSLLTLALAGIATFVSWRIREKLGRAAENADEAGDGAKHFAARAGLITNGLFFFIILVESLPILYFLHGC